MIALEGLLVIGEAVIALEGTELGDCDGFMLSRSDGGGVTSIVA